MATIPLLLMIMEAVSNNPTEDSKAVAYADDFTAAGSVRSLRSWWSTLCELGPKFGYYPEPSKSWLIVKPSFLSKTSIFADTEIKVTTEGKRHLGAVVGNTKFKEEYINEKIKVWIQEIRMLSEIAKTEPQASYSCFVSGYRHKMTYCMRTVPGIEHLLQQLDDVITTEFIPAITGGVTCTASERKLLSLPSKLGGLNIPLFSEVSNTIYNQSVLLTEEIF